MEADAANGIAAQDPVEWKHNALRHSFISYRVAAIQNVPRVALEAGNSPAMIFANYREVVNTRGRENMVRHCAGPARQRDSISSHKVKGSP